MFRHSRLPAFTLMEIIVVIGIIGITILIVSIAANPGQRFARARNVERASEVKEILNALSQKIADDRGAVPSGIDTTPKTIGTNPGPNYIDLTGTLTPTYISKVPAAPGKTAADTGYQVSIDNEGRLVVESTDEELGETISTSSTNINTSGNGNTESTPAGSGGDGIASSGCPSAPTNEIQWGLIDQASAITTPSDAIIDPECNLYVVGSGRVYKIDVNGVPTIFAGTGNMGNEFSGGRIFSASCNTADLGAVAAIGRDSSGVLYIGSLFVNSFFQQTLLIHRIKTDCSVDTIYQGSSGTIGSIRAIVVDSSGNLYYTVGTNSAIFKLSKSTNIKGNEVWINSVYCGLPSSEFFGLTQFADGPCVDARFGMMPDLVIDDSNTIYVTDTFNHRIRKVTSDQMVTTLAGNSSTGYVDGIGASAQFNNPRSITLDAGGRLYVEDGKLRRVNASTGAVTTIGGTGETGYQDGPLNQAQWGSNVKLTSANNNLLYLLDYNGNDVRKIGLAP